MSLFVLAGTSVPSANNALVRLQSTELHKLPRAFSARKAFWSLHLNAQQRRDLTKQKVRLICDSQ